MQSLWYDEAYTPVHVLHPSLWSTLGTVAHTENTPPLWYAVTWAFTRVLGTGAFALRLPSALAGIALVGVGWAIGARIGGRRTAAWLAAILVVNPLFVWYSQEARAYELFALLSACSLLWFLRAWPRPGARPTALWAGFSILALLTHYFAVFLVAPEALLLLAAAWRRTWAAVAAVAACAAALVPLVLAQGGRGTQWIGRWPLGDRVVRTVGYYVLGVDAGSLGHVLIVVCALPLLAALVLLAVLWRGRRLGRAEHAGIAVTLGLGAAAILVPLALALAGADYLAPRNLVGAWVPLSAALAAIATAGAARRAGAAVAAAACVAGAAIVLTTDLSPRLQRPDWHALARLIERGPARRAIVTVEEGSTPLAYYLPRFGLRYLSIRRSAAIREVDLVGFAPVQAGAPRAPAAGFRAAGARDLHGLLLYRYVAPAPRRLSGRRLRALAITPRSVEPSEALVTAATP